MNSVEGPLTSWIKATPPKPQVGNRTMLITNERNVHASLDIHVKEKRGRTELNIYEKREICRSTLSVKRIREKYGISRSGVYEIRSHGMSYFQKLIDRSMGNNHRNRAFNVRGGDYNDPEAACYNKSEAMERVHRSCVQASSLWCPLIRNIVIDMIRQNTGLTSISALEDTYAKFRRYYGWVWWRWGRIQCLAPADVNLRISRWAEKLYVQNTVRCYRFALFGDEPAMFVNGEVQGHTLAPVGCPQPKVVDTNPKETVTAFLAGVYDLGADEVYPLHPTVIFEHGAKRRESSTIYSEMTSYANKLKGIFIDVSSSGWVRDDIYPRMMHCDPHTIPVGCTKAIQIHDRVFNRLFKRAYNELLSTWRIQNSSCKVTRYLVLEWIKEAHSRVWVKHHNTILNAARRYIKQSARVSKEREGSRK